MSYPPPPPPPAGPPPPPPLSPPPPYVPASRRSRALPIVVAVVVALVLVAAAITIPLVALGGDDDGGDGGDGDERTATEETGAEVDTSNLDLVEEHSGLDPTHVDGDVDYEEAPPVGGNHSPQWLECGVYDVPVREENVVHDLEHGTVWITYREDSLDAAAIDALEGQLPDNGILSPYPEQDAPVVITVWGRQLELLGPDDPRIALFIAEYGAGETAPEPFASCAGGLTDPSGGTTV